MSLVAQFQSFTKISDMTRVVLEQLVYSPINSAHGIKLSMYNPLDNHKCINTTKPAVLRQYFGT